MTDNYTRKYFFLALFLIASTFAIIILWPFAKIIIISIALSAIFSPLYAWFNKRVTKYEWVAAILTVLCFIIVLCVPLFFIGSLVIEQSQSLYHWAIDRGGLDGVIGIINEKVATFFPGTGVDIRQGISQLVGSFSGSIGYMFSATLSSILSILLIALSMFYFLKDGNRWKSTLTKLSPLSDESDQKILSRLKIAVNGIIKGYLLIAVIQGVLMGIGLQIFGVPNAALWGVLTAVASLVPTIGTALVAIPAILFLFITGNNSAGIGLALWCGVIVGTVDNVLNPLIVGRTIDIHPLLILFTVLGGISIMGPAGILIGPLIISFIYALISVYKSEMV